MISDYFIVNLLIAFSPIAIIALPFVLAEVFDYIHKERKYRRENK